MSKDKDLAKELKKTEKTLSLALWIMRVLISTHPKNFQTPGWVSVVGYCIMIAWLCLPLAALIFNCLLLFKIFVGILTLMAIVIVSERPAKLLKKDFGPQPPEFPLSPEMKGSADYQELINLTWARHKKTWDAGEQITMRTAMARTAHEFPELYKNAEIFIRHQRFGKPMWSRPKKKPGHGNQGKEGPK